MIECTRGEPRLVKVADLAAGLDLSMQNVFKIVHILSRAKLVACSRGRHGGVRLARPAEQIRLGDIVRAMEATDLATDDRLPLGIEPNSGETDVNQALEQALGAFVEVLDQHSLAAMAGRVSSEKDGALHKGEAGAVRRPRAARGATVGVL